MLPSEPDPSGAARHDVSVDRLRREAKLLTCTKTSFSPLFVTAPNSSISRLTTLTSAVNPPSTVVTSELSASRLCASDESWLSRAAEEAAEEEESEEEREERPSKRLRRFCSFVISVSSSVEREDEGIPRSPPSPLVPPPPPSFPSASRTPSIPRQTPWSSSPFLRSARGRVRHLPSGERRSRG